LTYVDRNWARGERWLGEDRDPSMIYSAYLNRHNYDEYLERRAGVAVQASWLMLGRFEGWTNAWEGRLESVANEPFHDKSTYAEKFGSYLAATVAYRISSDTREGTEWDSTRGRLLESEIETGLADGFLLKWTARGEWRRSLARHWLWLVQAEVGLMPMRASSVGLSHRFQGGGEAAIRGFEEHGIGPVDPKNPLLHTGGATNLVLRNEVRYLWSDKIQLPVFLDIGALDDGPFSIGGLRASVGFGLRFAMPDSKQRAYVYIAENVLHEKTDNERTIRFGYTIDF
jgi:outer membrane translocation and assembly module TamA